MTFAELTYEELDRAIAHGGGVDHTSIVTPDVGAYVKAYPTIDFREVIRSIRTGALAKREEWGDKYWYLGMSDDRVPVIFHKDGYRIWNGYLDDIMARDWYIYHESKG